MNLTRTIFGIYFPKTLKKSNSLFIITKCSIIYAFVVVFCLMCRTGMFVLKEYSTFNHAVFYEIMLLSCAAWRKSGIVYYH